MTTPPRGPHHSPLHVRGHVLATRTVGAHQQLTLVAPGVGERARPGTFVAVTVGPEHLGRRALWIRRVRPLGGHAATLDLVVEPRGPGTRWLAALPAGSPVEVTGPLGRPFALPKQSARCLLVGEGYAAGPVLALAERLRERGCSVHLVLAGRDESHLLDALESRRAVPSITVAVGDPSDAIAASAEGAQVVYAAGSVATLHAAAEAAVRIGARSQVALEQPLTCATGLCQGCPVPVLDDEGGLRQVRACADGPVFPGDRLAWVTLREDVR